MCIEGDGKTPFNKKLDESVFEWIHERCSKGLRVARKLITKKPIVMYDNMVKEDEPNEAFTASTGWLRGFMKRYCLTLWQKTSVAQIDPDQFMDKLASFVLHVHRLPMKHPYDAADITARDENPVWVDMVSATTVDDTIKKNCDCKNNWTRKNSCSSLPNSKSRWNKISPFHCFQGCKARNCCIR